MVHPCLERRGVLRREGKGLEVGGPTESLSFVTECMRIHPWPILYVKDWSCVAAEREVVEGFGLETFGDSKG